MDAVITWVDGSDPKHIASRARYAGETVHHSASDATRFVNAGEIRFCVLSLLRFCPFVRRIHIVAAGQIPADMSDLLAHPVYADRISIVDLSEIFAEHADLLPVFSSRSIETMIHRIPDLDARFLDFFIGRSLNESDFFDSGRPILRGQLKPLPGKMLSCVKSRLRGERPGFSEAQRDAARLLGWTDTFC